MRRLIIISFVLGVATLTIGVALLQPSAKIITGLNLPVVTTSNLHYYKNTYTDPQPFVSGIYSADKNIEPPKNTIRAVIVPHHLTASESIASGIKTLARQSFKKIILVSPDHFHHCAVAVCTTDAEYETFFGDTRSDDSTVKNLTASPLANNNPKLFETEHGIFAVAPFIAHYFPGIAVTPIALSTEHKNTSMALSMFGAHKAEG